MNDRDYADPLVLRTLDTALKSRGATWNRILTEKAHATLQAVEKAVEDMCCGCAEESCEGCTSAWMLADAVRRAWRATP